ncbi:MAG: hypothetical protein FGF48_04215 [Candidatus Brockarchaeota archaeon]|nr:hypothetical protein [Candidatus Brockarchaeota archaeon]
MKRKTEQLDKILEMLARKRLEEAEKQLDAFKPSGGYEAGYLRGLRGILQTLRRPVEGSIMGEPAEELDKHVKSLMETVETHYLSQEEEGFFAAWVDFLGKLSGGE